MAVSRFSSKFVPGLAGVQVGASSFTLEIGESGDTTFEIPSVQQAGEYRITSNLEDNTYDVYLINSSGQNVGYSNTQFITASEEFSTVVIYGTSSNDTFTFLAIVPTDPEEEAISPVESSGIVGAYPVVNSVDISDLPDIDDSATITGSYFDENLVIELHGQDSSILTAKSVTINNTNSATFVRPDEITPEQAPYDIVVSKPGLAIPSSETNYKLLDALTVGGAPSWSTGSSLSNVTAGDVFSETIVATDPDGGNIVYVLESGTLPPGTSFDASTGNISGTTTTAGSYSFTVSATDEGGNSITREFSTTILVPVPLGGVVTEDASYIYHTFTSTDSFINPISDLSAEYLVVAGGGSASTSWHGGAGGGAGGLLNGSTSLAQDTYTITVGAGAAQTTESNSTGQKGSDSQIVGLVTATGGGGGITNFVDSSVADGGSGGGAINIVDDDIVATYSGLGIPGQGNDGGTSTADAYAGGGGGGAGEKGQNSISRLRGGAGGAGKNFSTWASATSTGDSGYYAGGGAGGLDGEALGAGENDKTQGGIGGGGDSGTWFGSPDGDPGQVNTGGGGGSQNRGNDDKSGAGGSGIVIIRYSK